MAKGLPKRTPKKKFANGGKIVGPGTGTSDDIQKNIPSGSYIMPADSTEAIGEENLQNMGAPVEAMVSNGEYELPPEQVHAIGAQTLDQMRNATHEPVAQQQDFADAPMLGGFGFHPDLGQTDQQGSNDMAELPKFQHGGQVGGLPRFNGGGLVANPLAGVGEYWSQSNADFEATNPSLLQRAGRALNPVTGFGSALGAMHDGASKGSAPEMAVAALQAVPVFGAVRAVAPTMKTAAGFVPSLGKTAAATAGSTGAAVAADEIQAQSFADGGVVDEEKRKRPNIFDMAELPKFQHGGQVGGLPKFNNGGLANEEEARRKTLEQFAPSAQPAAQPPMANIPPRESVLDTAAQHQQERMANAPAPTPAPEPASLGSVLKGGDGTANFGPFQIKNKMNYSNAPQPDHPGFVQGMKDVTEPVTSFYSDAGKAVAGVYATPFAGAADMARRQFARLGGADPSTLPGGQNKYSDVVGGMRGQGVQGLLDAAGTAKDYIQSGIRSSLDVEKAPEQPATGAPAPAAGTQDADQPGGIPKAQPDATPDATPEPAAGVAQPEFYKSGIQKPDMVGGVPTFTSEHVKNFDPNSIQTMSSQAMSSADPSTMARVAEARAAAVARGEPVPGVGGLNRGGGGTRVNVIRDQSQMDDLRRKAIAAATTPHKGAQNGQLTTGQLNAMRGLLSDDQAHQRGTDQNANVAESNRNTAQHYEATAGNNAAQHDLNERKFAAEQFAKMPELQQAQIKSGLYQQYQAALEAGNNERMRAIAGALQELGGTTGENLRNNFMTVGGGQEWDSQAGVMRNVPQRLVDLRSGQEVGGQPERRTSVSMDEVKATAKARGVSEKQVMEMLKQQGVSVNG